MSDIKDWSNTAASNNSAAPDGFPENMAPSGLNDASREVMAAIRRWYEDAQWINLGHTPTYVNTTTFTLTGDQTAEYHVGRRIRLTDASTLYGTIATSAYTTLTTITVTLDSGSLSASLSAVSLSALTYNNHAVPAVQDITGKADKVSGATSGNLAGLDGSGNLTDSGSSPGDFAPTASPAFTGTPTAPTQTAGDNSTKLATTAYVDALDTRMAAAWVNFDGTAASIVPRDGYNVASITDNGAGNYTPVTISPFPAAVGAAGAICGTINRFPMATVVSTTSWQVRLTNGSGGAVDEADVSSFVFA